MKKVLIFILFLTIGTALFAQQNPQKFALVIGNSNYTSISKLSNPVNDANDVAAALQDLGWKVDILHDASKEQMENAVIKLKNNLSSSKDSYGFFFYAGHGAKIGNNSFLFPVDTNNIESENQLHQMAFSEQTLLDNLDKADNELNMIVLDSSRDNPFNWARRVERGISNMLRVPANSIIMYSVGAGKAASDGTGRNSLFTSHLIANIKTKGLSIFEVFRKTATSVTNETGGKQMPELYVSYISFSHIEF